MQWLCFKTNPRQEFLARDFLNAQGFKVILPHYKRTIKHARKTTEVPYPLFPTYGFLLYDGYVSSLNLIKYAKGISYYLKKDNGNPGIVPQYIIDKIQSLKQKDGTYSIDSRCYKYGDRVKIIKGPLIGFNAIFKERADELRAKLLVNLLGRINIVNLDCYKIEHA